MEYLASYWQEVSIMPRISITTGQRHLAAAHNSTRMKVVACINSPWVRRVFIFYQVFISMIILLASFPKTTIIYILIITRMLHIHLYPQHTHVPSSS